MIELSRVHRLSYHHFNGVHVKSLIHPHRVILELSRKTGCTSCYTGAYFPHLAMEMIVFSQACYNLHYSDERYFFALLDTVSVILAETNLQRSTNFGLNCPTIHDSSVDCCD